jgi:proteasome lid subunit RPN8/RPN11
MQMVVHARSAGTIEVMGFTKGKVEGDTMIIMDAFALPVEGTETRVNAQADAYEYMVQYSQTNKQVDVLCRIHIYFSYVAVSVSLPARLEYFLGL